MEAHDEGERVRPIPIEGEGSAIPHRTGPGPESKIHVRAHPWMAMLLAGGSIAVVLGVVSVLGALEFETPSDAGPPSFSSQPVGAESGAEAPPMTLPPTLEESLPGLTDRLTLVTLTGDGFVTLLWDPSFRVPREYPLSIPRTAGGSGVLVAFDSAGRTLAIGDRSESGYRVYLGGPTDLGTDTDLITESAIEWHASEIGALAWVARRGDGQFELRTGSVNPLTGEVMNQIGVATLQVPARVVRWDSRGFILDDGQEVHSFDSTGRILWSQKGSVPAVTPSLVVITVRDSDQDTMRWGVVDRASGDPTDVDIAGSPEDVTVVTSSDLDIIATISRTDSRSTLTVGGPDLAAKRIVQIDADVTPIGFTTGNTYMVFEADGTNDLVFVNWRTGATQSLDVPDVYEVLAFDLG